MHLRKNDGSQKRERNKHAFLTTAKVLLTLLALLVIMDILGELGSRSHLDYYDKIENWIDIGLISVLILLLTLAIFQKRLFDMYNEELNLQDSFLQTLLENIEEPVIACDADGIINYYNHRARNSIKGISENVQLRTSNDWAEQEIIFHPDGTLMKEDEIPIFKAYREGKLENYEVAFRTEEKDGIYLANGRKLADEQGNNLGAVVVLHDITEQRRTNKKLLEIEQRYQSLLDHNLDMIYEFDLEGRFIQINKATETVSGYSFEELYMTHFSKYILPEYRSSSEFCINEAMKGKASYCENVIYHKKGHLVHLSITIVPIIIENKITGVYGIARDITKSKRLEENMMYLAYHDMLTGLPNRLLFNDRLQEALETAKEMNSQLSVMFLDLDRFKLVNDTYGHLIGDKLIKSVSARLLAILDSDCTVSRQGGDEFIILLNNHSHSKVKEVAETILKSLAMSFYIEEMEFFMKASMGISVYPQDGEDIETLIKNADMAMYQAKEKGKNSYQFFKREMNDKNFRKMMLEKRLHKAIENKEFMVYYQPKIGLNQRRVTGFEALIRWRDQELGMIPPFDFIPIAEENGLIVPITEWVLETVCNQMKKWEIKYREKMRVSVNISAIQFSQQNIVEMVKRVLKKTGMSSDCLQLEITESVTQKKEVFQNTLSQLNEMGINVSIDDFGTGYSSLSYLKDLPIYELKIDKSFVDGILHSQKEAAIVQTIISLGHNLGLNIVAEGVETSEQLKLLKQYGCDEVQGYYYSPPIPANEIEKCARDCLFPSQKILQKL